jgi:hypothetical protein
MRCKVVQNTHPFGGVYGIFYVLGSSKQRYLLLPSGDTAALPCFNGGLRGTPIAWGAQGKLFDFQMPIAPYSDQKAFSERAAAVQSILSQQSAATAKAQAAFDALLAQAFS